MVQLLTPMEASVPELIVLTTLLPLRSSILTYPESPGALQVIVCIVPGAHDSPPLGEVTVMPEVEVGGGVPLLMVKYELLTSLTEVSEMLLILMR